MTRLGRRDLLKAMAATAAGAAGTIVAGRGLESAFAATPSPRGPLAGTSLSAAAAPLLPVTAGVNYGIVAGGMFHPGGSTYTWFDQGTTIHPTNGGFYYYGLDFLPQGAVLTECQFYLTNPTTTPNCFLSAWSPIGNVATIFGSATAPISATEQTVSLGVTPTTVDHSQNWYNVDLENGAAADNILWGVRVGWMHNPGMTLFPDPRRVVSGDIIPFASGTTYGPFDATKKTDASASGVPVGATAAFCAVQSYTPGVLTLFPDGAADPGIANYSGTGTQGAGLNMVYMMVPLSSAGKFKIHSYITGKCYVDAWGYVI